MPELSNIQTYEKIIDADFRPTLEKFSRVLKRIGLWIVDLLTHKGYYGVGQSGFIDLSGNMLD